MEKQLQSQSYTLQQIVLRGIMQWQCYRLVGKDSENISFIKPRSTLTLSEQRLSEQQLSEWRPVLYPAGVLSNSSELDQSSRSLGWSQQQFPDVLLRVFLEWRAVYAVKVGGSEFSVSARAALMLSAGHWGLARFPAKHPIFAHNMRLGVNQSTTDIKWPLVKQCNQSGLTRFLNYVKGILVECLYNLFTCLLSCLVQFT